MRKPFKLFNLLAAVALTLVGQAVWADTATPAATPAVTVGGLVDSYYTFNFTNNSNNVSGIGNLGYFANSADNSYTLGLAELKAAATLGQTSAHLVLAYGQESSLGIGGPSGIDVLQAYVSYNTDKWTFNAGRFVTWLGDEVIESSSNWNYSHSLLFGVIPFWHTGFSVNFAPVSELSVTGYVVDGNNNVAATPDGKEFGLQAIITPSSQWIITLNGEFGPWAGNGGASNAMGNLTAEGIFVFKPDSMWSFALDAQYGMTSLPSGSTPSSNSYWGLALYGRDQIASDWAVALRLEDLSDSGELGLAFNNAGAWVAGSLMEGTLTVEHNFSSNMLVRLEGRYDTNSLPTGSGTTTAAAMLYGGGASTSQVTGTVSGVFSF